MTISDIRLSSEQQQQVQDNVGLVHYLVRKRKIFPDDYDDMISIGTIGLIKAVYTFDKSKRIQFTTYAAKCINNEINMYFRKQKNSLYDASLDYVIFEDSSGNTLTVLDTVLDEKSSGFEQQIEDRETVSKMISLLLNCFSLRDQVILFSFIAGITQREIADMLGISQSYVSRLTNKLFSKLKKYREIKRNYNEVFLVELKDDKLIIRFSTTDILQFSQISASFLYKTKDFEYLIECEVSFSNGQIALYLPIDTEALIFIAILLKDVNSFEMNGFIPETADFSRKRLNATYDGCCTELSFDEFWRELTKSVSNIIKSIPVATAEDQNEQTCESNA